LKERKKRQIQTIEIFRKRETDRQAETDTETETETEILRHTEKENETKEDTRMGVAGSGTNEGAGKRQDF